MLTTNGGFSFAPSFLACEDSGSASLSADCCLNVVVTSKKITSTISTSISATMMTAGVVRRLRTKKCMAFAYLFFRCAFGLAGFGIGNRRRIFVHGIWNFGIHPPDKIVEQRFHFHGEDFDFFAEITPCDKRRNGDEQADERRA